MWGIVSKWQNPFRSEHFPRSSRGKPTHFWGSRMKRPRMRKAAVSHYLWVGKVADGASCRCEYWICSRCSLIQQSLDVVRDVISRGWLKIKRVFGVFKSIWDDDSQVT